eukprot:4638576-Amphidinium_carterae.1
MAARVQGLMCTHAEKAKKAAIESRRRSAATTVGKRKREANDGYVEMGHKISKKTIDDWVACKRRD